jgi:hypothetical protein
MIHVERFEVTYPPFSSVLNLVIELFLLKSVKFEGYRRFGVFVFDGHFDLIAVFKKYLEATNPPHFQVFLGLGFTQNLNIRCSGIDCDKHPPYQVFTIFNNPQ